MQKLVHLILNQSDFCSVEFQKGADLAMLQPKAELENRTLDLRERREFMALSLKERRQRMAEQAAQIAAYYEERTEILDREAWQGGEIVEGR